MKRTLVPMALLALTLMFALSSALAVRAQSRPQAFACDSYSGQIAADTAWSPADCPAGYTISGNVLVQQGITLTILPGTLIKFNSGPTLTIEGRLAARGTAAQPITFTANKPAPAPGDWNGIVFNDSSIDATFDGAGNYTGGSIIQYALIEYGGATATPAVKLNNASPYLDHVTIGNNKGPGVSGLVASEMRLHAVTVQNNQGNGIDLKADYSSQSALKAVISGSLIANNSGAGIKLYNDGPYQSQGVVVISDSTVQGNTGPGIIVDQNYYVSNDVNLVGTMISDNQASGVIVVGTTVWVSGNTIKDNTGASDIWSSSGHVGGLDFSITSGGQGYIQGNIITGNAGSNSYSSRAKMTGGLALAGEGQLTVSGNTVSGNTFGGGIEVRSGKPIINANNIFGNTFGASPTPRNLNAGPYTSSDPNLDARNNWWGTTGIAEIEAAIYDYADNTGRNQALYDPFRSGPVAMISGRITDSQGRPVAGVAISAGDNRTVTSDMSGLYFVSGLDAGSYTLTPTRANFVFNPPSLNVTVAGADVSDQNFTATQTSYSIVGRIADNEGNPLTDVTVSDGAGHTTATDADGNYDLSGLSSGAYTIVPTRRGYTFTPASREVTVQQQDIFGQDFTGEIVYYTISGTIRKSDGSPLSSVRVDAGSGRTVYTGADGVYTFSNLQDNTYTIIPSYSNYTFEPAQREVMVGPSATGIDFTSYDPINQHVLSGRIVDRSGAPLAGVVVANGRGLTVASDADGNYRFERLPRGDYTLTPQLSDYFFAPRSRVTNVTEDTSGVNFVGGRAEGAGLLINYAIGRRGSYFTIVGMGYPPGQMLQATANGRPFGSVTTDTTGGFSAILSTGQADIGTYRIRLVASPGAAVVADDNASVSFTLDSTAPLRAKEGSGSDLSVPAGLNRMFVYLPLLKR